ncbi:MAG: CAP domain-containing protein [Solirubrobacteraceae bacterium]
MEAVRLRRLLLTGALVLAACAGGSPALAAQKHAHSSARHVGCAHAGLTPTASNVTLIRAATLCLVNRERAAAGERPLRPNARMRRAAQTHSQSMAFDDYFEHVGPGGVTPLARLRAVGYISSSRVGYEVGENIAWGTLYLATPRAIVAAWMASPGHRANILDANYRETGIGVVPHPPASLAHGQPGAIYTQDFGVIIRG